ncbi:MAG: NAD-dependent epimerase/dehydratase family protein [Flavobacteriales bacterium]
MNDRGTERILVTGGAGYIGSVLCRLLLRKGYQVRVLDRLMYGGGPLVELMETPGFEFQKGDVRKEQDLREALKGVDRVAHLAAIVGDPACAANPDLARSTNEEGSKFLYQEAEKVGVKQFVFASTCSNYGKTSDPDAYVDEEAPLNPVSLYAENKVAIERYLLGQDRSATCRPTCMRFATVYGLSPRIRFDLTVNEFTKELALGRELVVFGEQFWRPYCHVIDLARSIPAVFEASEEEVAFDVFNVGDTEENYQKQMIVDEMVKAIPESEIQYVQKDEDPRDYKVDFSKIHDRLGFRISKRVPEGIHAIKRVIEDGMISDPDANAYRNV